MNSRRLFAAMALVLAVSVGALGAAGIDGKWQAEVPGRGGPMSVTLDLRADGETLTGSIGDIEIQEGKVDGEAVSFVQVLTRGQRQIRFKYEGKVMGPSRRSCPSPWPLSPRSRRLWMSARRGCRSRRSGSTPRP